MTYQRIDGTHAHAHKKCHHSTDLPNIALITDCVDLFQNLLCLKLVEVILKQIGLGEGWSLSHYITGNTHMHGFASFCLQFKLIYVTMLLADVLWEYYSSER